MPGISTQSRQQAAHRMIKRWGGGPGWLIRGVTPRAATMARQSYQPIERGLFADGSSRFYVSAVGLTVAPDHELDFVEFKGMRYKILLPPGGPRPGGPFIYYDLNCMYFETI